MIIALTNPMNFHSYFNKKDIKLNFLKTMDLELKKTKPNILITGTPGTGKTTLSTLLSDQTGLIHLDVAKLIND